MAQRRQKIQVLPEGAFRISNFAGGMNLRDAPHLLQDNEALEVSNIVFSEVGALVRRGGYEKWNDTSVGTGMCYGLFRYKGSPCKWVMVVDGTFYVGDDSTKTFSQLATGFHSAHWIGVQVDNYLFLTNGVDTPQKFNGTNLYKLGVDAPTSAPTLAFNSTGQIPAGTYYYRITFVGDGVESSLGPQASITTTATGSIDLSNIPTSNDAQIRARRIYRSKANDPSTFYFLAEISDNTTTTYHDNTLDSDLGEIAVWYRNPPPVCTALAWHKGRLWVNDVNNPQYVWFSRPWEPQAFDPQMGVKLTLSEDDRVIALLPQGDNLVVYCLKSIWLIVGSEDAEFTPVKTYSEQGIISYLSPIQVFNTHFFLSRNGMYQFDGAVSQDISDKVRKVFDWIDYSWLPNTQLIYYPNPQQRLILFPVKEKDTLSPPTVWRIYLMVYDVRFQAWLKWDIPVGRMALDENNELYFTLIDPINKRGTGYLYHYSPSIYTDDGNTIAIRWISKQFAFDNEFIVKGMRQVGMVMRTQQGSFQITILADGGRNGAQTIAFNINNYAPAYYTEAEYMVSHYGETEPLERVAGCKDNLKGRYFQFWLNGISDQKTLAIDAFYGTYRLYPARKEVLL